MIEVLKTIAVAQYKIQEKRIKSYDKLFLSLDSFFDLLDINRINHPFLKCDDKPQGVIAVTSDSGLLGGANLHIINKALLELESSPGTLIVIGERGKAYLRDTSVPFVSFGGIKDEERYEQAMQLRDYCLDQIDQGTFGRLKVVYSKPVSFTVQRIEVLPLIPFMPASPKNVSSKLASEIIFESTPGDMIKYLVHLWIGMRLYEIFGLSRLSEFAARFLHLEGSHQRLKDIDVKIRQEYFRVRHELIDRNMRELFAARSLYAGR